MKRIGKIILPILSILTLSSCSGSPFTSEEFTSRIFFNLWDFLIVLTAFIVLVLIAFFFAYKPIKEFAKKRADYVEGKLRTAEEREKKSQNLISEGEKALLESKRNAALIVDEARENATKIKDEIINEAKLEAQNEKQKAQEEIAQEIEANKDAIHKEIVDVALKASEELLNREVSKDDNKRLLDDFVDNLNKKEK